MWTSACNIRSNTSLHLLKILVEVISAHMPMTTQARDFKLARAAFKGCGGFNSKSVVSALLMVLSWKVTNCEQIVVQIHVVMIQIS